MADEHLSKRSHASLYDSGNLLYKRIKRESLNFTTSEKLEICRKSFAHVCPWKHVTHLSLNFKRKPIHRLSLLWKYIKRKRKVITDFHFPFFFHITMWTITLSMLLCGICSSLLTSLANSYDL